ncbi:PD-(D/E)XK nuclease family protein [Myxococcota bacterium]|nr:PD-(D/E)XK nuclease family protein [Myxococcota bacterium]
MVLAPIEQFDDDIHVSASSVRSIIEGCPREAFYKYIAGYEPQDRSSGLVLGSAVHEALALFYLTLQQSHREATLQEMVDIAHASIDAAENVHTKDGEEPMKVTATRLIEAFLEHGYRPRGKILAVEERFSITVHDPYTGEVLPERLIGYFDLVEAVDGGVVVTDHKTAARHDKAKGEEQDIQMALYAHAARQIYGVEHVTLQFQSLIKTKEAKVVVQPLVPQDTDTALETVYSAVTHMNLALNMDRPEVLMYKRPSWKCPGCGYRSRCQG